MGKSKACNHHAIQHIVDEIYRITSLLASNLEVSLQNKHEEEKLKMLNLMEQEESEIKQRSNTNWLTFGDLNLTFFA